MAKIDLQKDKHELELNSAITEKTDVIKSEENECKLVTKKTEDLKQFNHVISSTIESLVRELALPVDASEKLDKEKQMLYFTTLEQHLNSQIKSAMDSKLTTENLAGVKVEDSKEGEEDIEQNKQMEQTMKILVDSNLNLEDVTTKED